MKGLFGKRLEGMEESRLVEDGGGETKRGWRNRVEGRELRFCRESLNWITRVVGG